MNRLISSAVFIFIMLNTLKTEAQSANWQPMVRDVMVIYKDSVVKAQVLLQSENIETSNNLIYYWYSQNRINMNMGGYSGSLLHGEYQVYSNDKKLIEQGYFEHGLKNGTWKYWNSKGILRQSIGFRAGLPDGECILYDANGVQLEKKKYRAGELQVETVGKIKIWKEEREKLKQQKVDSLVTDTIK